MKLKFIYIIFLTLIFPSQSKVGTTAAQFLGIGVGSRAMSMGGAFTSMIGDPSSLNFKSLMLIGLLIQTGFMDLIFIKLIIKVH